MNDVTFWEKMSKLYNDLSVSRQMDTEYIRTVEFCGQPSLPRPQQITEDTVKLFSVDNPNTRQLLDAKEKALISLKSTLGMMRILTRDYNIEEPPQIYKDAQEAIRILENDVKF